MSHPWLHKGGKVFIHSNEGRVRGRVAYAGDIAFDGCAPAQIHAQGVLQTISTFLPLLIADLMPRFVDAYNTHILPGRF
jgi:hypothetical protein